MIRVKDSVVVTHEPIYQAMKTFESTFCSILLVILSTTMPAALANAGNPFSIEILRLDKRLKVPRNGADALLTLRFTSNLDKSTKIPFSVISFSPPGADCATLSCLWKGGKSGDTHDIDVTGEPLYLAPFGVAAMQFPVRLPRQPGKYSLCVNFDNKRLMQIFDSRSDVPEDLVYCTCTSEKPFIYSVRGDQAVKK
jgi:hypothetical protein